jgi:hypothetical protein
MGEVLPLPTVGEIFDDVRDGGRAMRVSFHADQGIVVVSLWAGALCRGSFRMAVEDAQRLHTLLDVVDGPKQQPVVPQQRAFDEAG